MNYKNHLKVGDTIRITKKVPYYNNVVIGDIGTINYVSKSGKYSVNIDGKKNPHDLDKTHKRLYGELYDFWIPFSYCEEAMTKNEMIRKCLFENADVLDEVRKEEKADMKEIKNQKVVDLYFSRKQNELDEIHKERRKNIINADANYIFASELQKQLNEYAKDKEELKNAKLNIIELPITEETKEAITKLDDEFIKSCKSLEDEKKEILVMLSGCETYEQEMVILKSYRIVDEYNIMMPISVD